MPTILWDASGCAKRYVPEPGRATVNALFRLSPAFSQCFTAIGYSETYSILRRRLNAGTITLPDYNAARAVMRREILLGSRFELLQVTDSLVLAGLPLIDRHNINATDAAILATFLDYRASLTPQELPAVLVASDHRLLRAAQAEGMPAIDPEAVSAADVPAFFAAL